MYICLLYDVSLSVWEDVPALDVKVLAQQQVFEGRVSGEGRNDTEKISIQPWNEHENEEAESKVTEANATEGKEMGWRSVGADKSFFSFMQLDVSPLSEMSSVLMQETLGKRSCIIPAPADLSWEADKRREWKRDRERRDHGLIEREKTLRGLNIYNLYYALKYFSITQLKEHVAINAKVKLTAFSFLTVFQISFGIVCYVETRAGCFYSSGFFRTIFLKVNYYAGTFSIVLLF